MKHLRYKIFMLATVVVSMFMASCAKDYQDDIDKLNATHTSIEKRVDNLETQVKAYNSQLQELSVLSAAVEQGFYISDVKSTADGYELKLSNGHVIVLQTTTGGILTAMPSVSMTQVNGLFYWTLNGQLFIGPDGNPVRTSGQAPMVKFDYTLNQWLVSVDGGVTYQDINTYVSVFINNQVLLQVINSYVDQQSTVLFNKEMLFQIVSTYIQLNYKQLFNTQILNEVVANHITERYTRLFSYELLDEIFKQYNYEYVTSNIKVEELTNVIISFMQEHKEIFIDNEVLYEILSSYMTQNQTTIFTEDILLEVVNNFIEHNQNYINVELLTQVITNYIDQHSDVVFNTETVRRMLLEYVQKNYVQMFSQTILIQALTNYVIRNKTTIFNETLIREIVDNYVQNNHTTIFSQTMINEIVNNYISMNSTTVFNRDILIEVITSYFERNYNLFIDKTLITNAVNDYVSKHQTTIIDVDIIRSIVNSYLTSYYREVFSYDLLTQVIYTYFSENREVIAHYVSQGIEVISDVRVDNEYCVVTLANGQTIKLVYYDALASLSQRVQSIVALPKANGHVEEILLDSGGYLRVNYLVAPASMVKVIQNLYFDGKIVIELLGTDENGKIDILKIAEPEDMGNGVLRIIARTQTYGEVKAIALHIKETKAGGTDIMTEFTVVDSEKMKGYLQCPDGNHPHQINLGLPSGTLWSCCNVRAKTPEDYGEYYAWGESWQKDEYSWKSYSFGNNFSDIENIGNDIAMTKYDVAASKWGKDWCMPTRVQMKELCDNCSFEWTTQSNVIGCKVKGTNGGTIFLPAAGWYYDTKLAANGYAGYYWSSNIGEVSYNATILELDEKSHYVVSSSDMGFRCNGLPVRPVAEP